LNRSQIANSHLQSKLPPGPPIYKGKYEAPSGLQPIPTETGHYPPELEVTYEDLIRQIARPALKLATYINTAWSGYMADESVIKKYGSVAMAGIKESREVLAALKPQIEAFKKASQ
jgi:hypothetical protein